MPAPPPKDEREELLDKMIAIGKKFHSKSAREAAEMMKSRALTDAEWSKFGPEWEARWDEWS
jgi:ribosomal protein L17